MMNITSCSEAADKQIYDAFMLCFSDYMLTVKIKQDSFIKRFFGCEGNKREYSYIACEDSAPVGVCFGGLKTDEEIKTFRCGGMAVVAEARGKGVAAALFDMHVKKAKELGCGQLFLEVIDGNDRAVAFYKKYGYDKVYNLTYRVLNGKSVERFVSDKAVYEKVEPVSLREAESLRQKDTSHLAWQCSFDYVRHLDAKCYGIKRDGELLAAIAADAAKVYYLWVDAAYRNRGFAKALIHRIICDLRPKTLHFTYSNNHSAHVFANHLDMDYGKVHQIEMYREI